MDRDLLKNTGKINLILLLVVSVGVLFAGMLIGGLGMIIDFTVVSGEKVFFLITIFGFTLAVLFVGVLFALEGFSVRFFVRNVVLMSLVGLVLFNHSSLFETVGYTYLFMAYLILMPLSIQLTLLMLDGRLVKFFSMRFKKLASA